MTRVPFLLAASAAGALLLVGSAQAQLGAPPVPPGNPITPSKTLLGKALFWDEQLSSNNQVACGTCHFPTAGGSDPRTLENPDARHPGFDGVLGNFGDVSGSPGVPLRAADGTYVADPVFGTEPQVTDRKAPSVVDSAFFTLSFWDGRAEEELRDPLTDQVVMASGAALENQVLGPPLYEVEMGHLGRDWGDVVARLEAAPPLGLAWDVPDALANWIGDRSYPQLFQEAFGTPDITPVRLAMAIATYERTLVSDQTPFDDWLAGDGNALSTLEFQGLSAFIIPGRCDECHTFPLLADDDFHYTGVRPAEQDEGRAKITGLPEDVGLYKTPSLRNVALRAPYFHDGSAETLFETVDFYVRGGDFTHTNLDQFIFEVDYTPLDEVAVVAFMSRPLTDPRVRDGKPPFDRPRLYSESARAPDPFGGGSAGTGGFVPRHLALDPPMLGNPEFTFGMADGLAGQPVLLALDAFAAPPGTTYLGTPIHVALSPHLALVAHGVLLGSGAGDGYTSATAEIPDEPAFAGAELIAQWFVLDPGAASGWAASPGLRITFFAPR
jgi:cytochrome c peroxidase